MGWEGYEVLVTVCVPFGAPFWQSLEKLDRKLPSASQRSMGASLVQGFYKQYPKSHRQPMLTHLLTPATHMPLLSPGPELISPKPN